MQSAAEQLFQAITTNPAPPAWRWQEWLQRVREVITGPVDWKAEQALLALTRFAGKLTLAAGSSKPHSMSPEDMLKSLAIQALAKHTGLTHLLEMQRVEATATSSVLASIVRAAIREAASIKGREGDLDVVVDVRRPRQEEKQAGSLGKGIMRKPTKALPRGNPGAGQAQQLSLGFFTKYERHWTLKGRRSAKKAVVHGYGLTYFPGNKVKQLRTEESLMRA